LYTVAAFTLAIHEAFLWSPAVTVVPIVAVFDYKAFYDRFIDKLIKTYKEEFTNHGFKIERIAHDEDDEADKLRLPGIKTNYRKYANDVTIDLMPIEAMYETTTSDVLVPALQFAPRIIMSNWIPSCAAEEDRDIGTSFLVVKPRGMPSAAEFEVRSMFSLPLPCLCCIASSLSLYVYPLATSCC
jgi:hypothetical protein